MAYIIQIYLLYLKGKLCIHNLCISDFFLSLTRPGRWVWGGKYMALLCRLLMGKTLLQRFGWGLRPGLWNTIAKIGWGLRPGPWNTIAKIGWGLDEALETPSLRSGRGLRSGLWQFQQVGAVLQAAASWVDLMRKKTVRQSSLDCLLTEPPLCLEWRGGFSTRVSQALGSCADKSSFPSRPGLVHSFGHWESTCTLKMGSLFLCEWNFDIRYWFHAFMHFKNWRYNFWYPKCWRWLANFELPASAF